LDGLVLNEKLPSSLLTTPEIKIESLFSNSATVARDSLVWFSPMTVPYIFCELKHIGYAIDNISAIKYLFIGFILQ
jgi:hypothetical protein